jgi:hypothetical protein
MVQKRSEGEGVVVMTLKKAFLRVVEEEVSRYLL